MTRIFKCIAKWGGEVVAVHASCEQLPYHNKRDNIDSNGGYVAYVMYVKMNEQTGTSFNYWIPIRHV